MLAELLATIALAGAQADPPPAVVWAVGDGAVGTEPAKRLARTVGADHPDRFLYLGDVYDSGTPAEFDRNYDSVYGALAPITAPTPGNHDWPNRASGYFPYWKAKLGRALRSWYGLEVGGWELLSLNSEALHSAGSPQLRWLGRRLRATPGNCRIAFWHRPRWSAGTHGDQPDVAPLWDALEGRAALVLNGHDHDSQRFRRRGGIVELVAGAGGASLYPLDRGGSRRLVWGNDRVHAALRLELTPGRARYEFQTADGRVLNRGSVRCSTTSAP
jgi:hypothetical protein